METLAHGTYEDWRDRLCNYNIYSLKQYWLNSRGVKRPLFLYDFTESVGILK